MLFMGVKLGVGTVSGRRISVGRIALEERHVGRDIVEKPPHGVRDARR